MRYLTDENEDLATMPSTDTYLLRIAKEQSSSDDDAGSKIRLHGIEDSNSLQLINYDDGWCKDLQYSPLPAVAARQRTPLQPSATNNLDIERPRNGIFDHTHNVNDVESVPAREMNDIPKVIIFDKSAGHCEEGTLDDSNSNARSALNRKRDFREMNHQCCRQVADDFGWDDCSTILSRSTMTNKVSAVRCEPKSRECWSRATLEVQNAASFFRAPLWTRNSSTYSNYNLSPSKMKSIVQYFWKEQLKSQCPTVAIKETELLLGIDEREDFHPVSQSSIANWTASLSRKRAFTDTCYTHDFNTNGEFLPTNTNVSFVTGGERSTNSSSHLSPLFSKRFGPNTNSTRIRQQNRSSRYPLCRFVSRRNAVCAMVDRSRTGTYWRQQCRNYTLCPTSTGN